MPPRRPGPPPPGGRSAGAQRSQQGAAGHRPPPPGNRRPPAPPPAEQATALVRPVEPDPYEREPDLITHHAHNGTEDPYDDRYDDRHESTPLGAEGDEPYDEEPAEDEDGDKNKTLTPKQRKKRRWKIIRRVLYAMFGLFVVVPAIAFVITYFLVDVPSQESVASLQSQPITLTYADGSPMGKIAPASGGSRYLLKPGEIPDVVKHAVYAAEDSSFETNSGFDVGGILRAVYNNVTGGQGGGSTISQQYIKKATANEAPTLTRKWTELAKSFKMNNQMSKEEIITAYLNTIYFGRGANGIEAAAQAYFKKPAKELSSSEAALLAGLIQGPSRSENDAYAQRRWNFVMDQMVANNWLPAAERAAATYPKPIPKAQAKADDAGTLSLHIRNRVIDELEARGYDQDRLHQGGFKITTTIDPKAQKMAEESVAEGMKGQTDENILNALVAVDPKTGGVVAYWGGPDWTKNEQGQDVQAHDWANVPHNPGSAFKAFDLAAWLKMGKGLGETFDGSNNRKFDVGGGNYRTIKNAGESANCGTQCTVAEAMKVSANTVFYDMVINKTKVDPVAKAAKEAGVETADEGGTSILYPDINIALGGGRTVTTAEDMAAGFATFAGEGVRQKQHFVAKLTNSQDEVEFDETAPKGTPAFSDDADKSKQIAGNVTDALEEVVPYSKLKCPSGHDCAGKTGTQQYDFKDSDPASYRDRNAQTWMVGYTPSISTAVWVGGDGNKPLHDKNNKPIYGRTIAGPIWEDFMSRYLTGKPAEKFGKVKPIGKDARTVVTTTAQKPPEKSTPPPETTSSTPPPPTSTEPTETTPTKPTKPTKPPWSRPGPGTSDPLFPNTGDP
ncbi:Membrane carboxypeptidase (penicillin-binding protein) [Amycolatopsis regifaucium]|nr:Membrane carboxypeptidase (penicillin-binding protein) [Amycolatopsis regifaucium]